MRKLKSVPSKINFRDYAATSGFSPYSNEGRVLLDVLNAYSDCLPETVETDGLERDLKFFSKALVFLVEAIQIMKLATPNGYNDFQAENCSQLLEIFGDTARVFIAREGSVCMYIKPSKNVWLNRSDDIQKIADELYYDTELNAFRVWWD